jgi:hypothetical protein
MSNNNSLNHTQVSIFRLGVWLFCYWPGLKVLSVYLGFVLIFVGLMWKRGAGNSFELIILPAMLGLFLLSFIAVAGFAWAVLQILMARLTSRGKMAEEFERILCAEGKTPLLIFYKSISRLF